MKNKIILIKNFIFSVITGIMSTFIKRDEKYLAFGSWCGELYIDNSKYLFEYAIKTLKDYKVIWIGNENVKEIIEENVELNDRVKILKKDSLKSVIELLKCKYMFCTQMHRADLCSYNVYNKAVIYSLDHGIPLKKWAQDAVDYKGEFNDLSILKNIYYKIIGESKKYNYFITASPLHDEANISALKYRGATRERNLGTGTPRNDMFCNYNKELALKLKKKYANIIGFDYNKKIIMYIPTYRRKGKKIETFINRTDRELEKLNHILQKYNAVIIEKNHFVTDKQGISNEVSNINNIIKITEAVDLQEMLMFTDIQISDYSGCCLDFMLLDRPIIHYAYDYEFYRDEDSGLYYEIDDFSGGKVTKTFDETVNEIEQLLMGKDEFSEKREYVRKKYLTYENGTASKQIIDGLVKMNN